MLNCGTCSPPQFCGGGGVNKCGDNAGNVCAGSGCRPLTSCQPLGDECGSAGDGCGGLLDCGSCPFSEECSTNQKCLWPADAGPCAPATCQSLGYDCGSASDGCGQWLECGTCPVSQFCGGGGFRRCGGTCSPLDTCQVTCSSADGGSCYGSSCIASGYACGYAPNGCGGLLDCGACGEDAGAQEATTD
jgi:hypothetical protein